MGCGDAEQRTEGGMPGTTAVEAEDELVEIGLQVAAAQAVIDAQGPDFKVGEDAVRPGEDDMGGHVADDMGIVIDAGRAGISRPSVGLGGGARGEIGFEESMQAGGRVIGHLGEPNAAGAGAAILDLDRAGDEDFALMAASATAGERVVLAAADDFGLVNLDQASEHAAVGRHHAAAQLCRHQPSRFVRAQSKLALQLQCRNAVGMGRHQIGRPEPRGQRQLGVVHDRAGGHRGLLAAAGAFPSPCLGLQLPRFVPAASRADKALRPARRDKVSDAGRLIREAALKLDQRAGKIGHMRLANQTVCSLYVLSRRAAAAPLQIGSPDAGG